MFETPITVVGTIVTDPVRRTVGDQEVINFRVASNSRRRTAEGTWEPGNSLFVTVNCWGKLVTGVGAALGKSAPVIVVGSLYTSEYVDREGIRRSSLQMRASSVGPDLSRVIVRIEKSGYPGVEGGVEGGVEAGVEAGVGAGRETDDAPASSPTGDPAGAHAERDSGSAGARSELSPV